MEDKVFVLTENSEEIRKKIKAAGIQVCRCASFEGACWLDYQTNITDMVHGVGFTDEVGAFCGLDTQEKALEAFVSDCMNMVVCKDVDEFINYIKEFENGNKIE